ncbi:MAG: hypothetical protein H7066_08640 [Cytophagaceae bacterium]|nr:hypothetical protein [Gemmatimonadaceae bacterium]
MHRRRACVLGLALCAVAPDTDVSAQAQAPAPLPTCRQTLDSLDARLRRNYAGFLLEVRGARRDAYDVMVQRVGRRADTTSLNACYPVLASYTAWYEDPHVFVLQSQSVDSTERAQRIASLRHVRVSEADVRADLARRAASRDPLEGIWYDGALRVAVVRDPDREAGTFVAVVLQGDSASWPIGAVRAEFRRVRADEYAARLFTRAFAEMTLTARIHKRTMLRLSPGIWGRAFPLSPADTGLVDTIDVHRPRVSVRERSVVVSMPSHDGAHTRRLDHLVAAHAADMAARPLLIIDLRGNEGGGAMTSRALHPWVASATSRATPFDSGAAVMLSSPHQVAYAKRFTGTDTSAFVRSLVARLEANPGQLVPLEETPSPSAPDSSRAGNWRVVVMVDRGTVSAAEVLVLRALRSTRATVVGEPTEGALDYQSVQVVGLGTGYTRWALGYPTITAHADLPKRGMRGRGITPEVRIDWSKVADPIAEVERRFAR